MKKKITNKIKKNELKNVDLKNIKGGTTDSNNTDFGFQGASLVVANK